jgi:hypothetical protein
MAQKDKELYKPIPLEIYPGNLDKSKRGEYGSRQVVITADRLLFNAKSDSVFLTSQKAISLSTNGNIHLDCTYNERGERNKIVLSAPIIHLGLTSKYEEPTSPAVRGDALIVQFENLLDSLQELINVISELEYETGGGEAVNATNIDTLYSFLKPEGPFQLILKDIKAGGFLSKRVSLE